MERFSVFYDILTKLIYLENRIHILHFIALTEIIVWKCGSFLLLLSMSILKIFDSFLHLMLDNLNQLDNTNRSEFGF